MERQAFREAVFARDNHECVVPWCEQQAQDAHHIIERKLWEDGGYEVDNGASLCAEHHRAAENNHFPPAACRLWAGIEQRLIPPQLDDSKDYNKWGEELNKPNRRRIKYPSSPYFAFAPDITNPVISSESFVDKPVVTTIKMDGSNVVLSRGHCAARNGVSAHHRIFDFLKKQHARLAHKIPEHLLVFGEWLYAKHSIPYEDLDGFLQLFAVYDMQRRLWLSWDAVERLADALGVVTVPVVSHDVFSSAGKFVSETTRRARNAINCGHEGVVVRSRFAFHYGQFGDNLGKFVRENHVQSGEHWRDGAVVRNSLGHDSQ